MSRCGNASENRIATCDLCPLPRQERIPPGFLLTFVLSNSVHIREVSGTNELSNKKPAARVHLLCVAGDVVLIISLFKLKPLNFLSRFHLFAKAEKL